MKIRTDFITNSSSTGNIVIVIENPLLLEIFLKYKELGVFYDEEVSFDIGTITDPEFDMEDGEEIKTPAFFYSEDGAPWSPEPDSLDGVLDMILDRMRDYLADVNLFDQMKRELYERIDEIKANYFHVYVEGGEYYWGHDLSDSFEYLSKNYELDPYKLQNTYIEWMFKYDPQHGERSNVKVNTTENLDEDKRQ